jgi:hypothetical protein
MAAVRSALEHLFMRYEPGIVCVPKRDFILVTDSVTVGLWPPSALLAYLSMVNNVQLFPAVMNA